MPSAENKVYNLDDLEPQKVLKNLFNQKTKGIFCDVKLCLQGSVTWGHACVIAPLSSYIMERFHPNSNTNHWCPQKPLVIDLDTMITVRQDKCALCLSTLVDFMYSQDLVILDGHLRHFSKMIYYLKIFDLFPIFNSYIDDANLASLINNKSNVQELPVVFVADGKSLKTAEMDKPVMLLKPMAKIKDAPNSLLGNIDEMSNLFQEPPGKIKQLNTSLELNTISAESPLISSESLDGIVEEHNYGINLKRKCEFLCCTGDVVSSNPSVNHRRTISCDMCSFKSVFVKKVLKHIESAGHLGTMCPICTQKFESAVSLQKHLKDHINQKPFLCQFCSKRSRFWEFYKMHLKVHCRNKNFYCEVCQKSFKSQQNLKVHLKSHKTNYLCNGCNFLSSDVDDFKAHLFVHNEIASSVVTIDPQNSFDNYMSISDDDLMKHKTAMQFFCSLCGKRFTKKSNLKRHNELKHSSVPNFNCFKCAYETKRTDLLKRHMKNHHNCLPKEGLSKRVTKRVSKKQKLEKNQSEVVGVLIPVQLVSDSSTLDAFAVKTSVNGEPKSVEDNCRIKFQSDKSNSSPKRNANITSVLQKHPLSNSSVDNRFAFADTCHTNINGGLDTLHNCRAENDSSDPLFRNNEAQVRNDFRGKVQNIDSNDEANVQLSLNTGNPTCNKIIDLTQPVLNISRDLTESFLALEERNTNLNSTEVVEPDLLTKSGEFWLNEATGEFLNENSLVNVQVIDSSGRFKTVSLSAENPQKDPKDPLHTLILSDASKTVSIFDIRDDIDEFQSNPQTPQTNLVEVDDPDNLFPWNCIDSNFCSIWVLNEATGELDMVSFNVQPVKHSDESQLDENTGVFSTIDDDETALFLNEGTGDLSVIYFNPSKRECDSSRRLHGEQGVQDVPDNVSERSNDEDEFLNAEFFKATASFMAHKENEIFLNELTGEFDTNIVDFNDQHLDILENQISCSESYLNEETGEILWNVLNKNVGSDFFTNSESFKYDPDDSLNCDDFEPFADEMNDFSSQFCLETAQDWQSETCDILLNECTGELVKKS